MQILQEKLRAKPLISGLVINYGMQRDMKFKKIINIILLQSIMELRQIF